MGNTTGKREGKDGGPPLSPKESPNTFDFGSAKAQLIHDPSSFDDFELPPRDGPHRPRASTISQSSLQSNALPTVFHYEGSNNKTVCISGTFNNWDKKIPMVKSQGDFSVIIELPEGDHQYKFYVDGNWVHDHTMPTLVNEHGTYNNIIKVQKSDFEVFEALAIDSVNSGTSPRVPHSSVSDISGSPPGEYNQDIPPRRLHEKTSGPPILPPHLLQVILNKDIALQCEPSLLPEPNHVMLNHLYALSIKDGVMVLSSTHRIRGKKYVTTVFYKPISEI
ncbi:5'-AMP-activated protein kinase subunit beta-1-like isoform X2 [Glandiceps talaboti]